jgi:hypothetical protein
MAEGRRFLFRSQLTAQALQAVRAAGVTIAPTLRELQWISVPAGNVVPGHY